MKGKSFLYNIYIFVVKINSNRIVYVIYIFKLNEKLSLY